MTTEKSTVLAKLRADIAARLRPLCADWPEDAFNAMVERIAEVTFRFDVGTPYDRRDSDRLMADLSEVLRRNEETRHKRDEPDE